MVHSRTNSRECFEAEQDAVLDFQFELLDLLNESGLSKTELAKLLGVSKARVSQLFAADANPALRTMVRVCHALGHRLTPSVERIGADDREWNGGPGSSGSAEARYAYAVGAGSDAANENWFYDQSLAA